VIEAILIRIKICEVSFNFSAVDDTKHLESKMIKRDCLLDLIEFFDSDDSQHEPGEKLDKEAIEEQENLKKLRPLILVNEEVMQPVFDMIWFNLIRTPKV
jgi:hypothetical protein